MYQLRSDDSPLSKRYAEIALRTSQASGAQLFFSMDVAEAHCIWSDKIWCKRFLLADVVIHWVSQISTYVDLLVSEFTNMLGLLPQLVKQNPELKLLCAQIDARIIYLNQFACIL
jgi:hypothetical protein